MTEENQSGEHHTEHKTHSEHETKHVSKDLKLKKTALWKSISVILGILLIVSLYFNFSGKSGLSVGNTISIDEAADEAVNYINNYLLQPGITATLQSKSDAGNLYNVKMDIGGREYDSYVTKDGKLLFPNSVDLSVKPEVLPTEPTEPTIVDASADDDAVKGDENAPVTIIEFSEYECPFCVRFYEQTLPSIDEEYIKTGKVKLIFRDYPLSFHKNAQKAAEAAECAGEQGKYYEMHNKLFEDGVKGGVDSFKQFAKDLGLDTTKFDECLDSGAMESEVQKDFNEGASYGVSGTPAFFINGVFVSGAQPFENFKAIIDAELEK